MPALLDILAVVCFAFLVCSAFSHTPHGSDNCGKTESKSSSTSMPEIPNELIVEIIRHLQYREMTLRSCSLVCKTWVPLSRCHLFYCISLNHSNAPAFVALLQSKSGSSIGSFVQQVRIRRELSHPPWMKEILPVLSSYLHPASLHLDIQNSIYRDYVPSELEGLSMYNEDLSVFRDTFQETVRLSLSLDCDTFAEGVQVISSFPLLETLELNGDWYTGRKAYVPCDTPYLPSLVRSITCFQGSSPFFLWLLHQPHVPSVTSLSLRNTYVTKTVRSYLQALGENLRHLSLELNFRHSTDPPDQIDISQNVGLRTIALYSQVDVISAAIQLLSQVRSTDIEKVEIGLSEHAFPSNLTDAEPPELWSKLELLLSTPRFSKLRELRVTIPGCSLHRIENLLPLCKSRGILCVLS